MSGGQIPINQPGATLDIALRNDSNSSTVYAYITGQALENNNRVVLIQSDGTTTYFPDNPSQILQPLQQDVAIPLGAPGTTTNVKVPHIAGGRIWFAIDDKLAFLLNPGGNGPALVEPSVSNPTDPSINVKWGFCEFTFNTDQLYANISYVDFISVPISLNLTTASGVAQNVSGFSTDGLTQVAELLRAQNSKDGAGWDQLIVQTYGNASVPLRVLSPNLGRVMNSGLLSTYFDPYVDQVYAYYQQNVLSVDTQGQFGVVTGQVSQDSVSSGNPSLTFGSNQFAKPSTGDIWSCSTGPFATGSNAEVNAIIPRLSAAFNRSTLLATNVIPGSSDLYYQNDVTNHYARIVHSVNVDGKGYAFPYDDVQPTGAPDLSGKIQAGDPILWTIGVGGGQAQ